MAFNFLKRKEDAPPDVGKEEEYEEQKKGKKKESEDDYEIGQGAGDEQEEPEEEIPIKNFKSKKVSGKSSTSKLGSNSRSGDSEAVSSFATEKINAKMEALDSLIRGYGERFSNMSQQIGEVRAMTLANEKSILKAIQESGMAVDIVKEVKPEKLAVNYQKLDMKIATISEKIETNRQFEETIMNEVKDLRRKSGMFVGTEALLKLNDEVKKDLINIQQLGAKVKMNTDKSEQIFIELRRGFSESEKLNGVVANLDASYSGIKKELEKVRVDFSNIVNQNDFDDFKKSFNNKITVIENSLNSLSGIKEENEKLGQLIETTVSIARKNREDIADIAISIGDDHIKRVSDYENQLAAILSIIDTLAGQVSTIKKKVGISELGKINVNTANIKPVNKKYNMQNMNVGQNISKRLFLKTTEIPEKILKVQDNTIDEEEQRIIDIKKGKFSGKNKSINMQNSFNSKKNK